MTAVRKSRGPYANAPFQREKILRGALEYFGQKGYWGSSMRDIADHVGMSQASMRHYFGTKTELLSWKSEIFPRAKQRVEQKW
jgi:AcrR family transcriptional regulator